MSKFAEEALWLVPLPVIILEVSGKNPLDFKLGWFNAAAENFLEQRLEKGLGLRENVSLGDQFWQITERVLREGAKAIISEVLYKSPGGQNHSLSIEIVCLDQKTLLLMATHGEEKHHISHYDSQTGLLRRESFLDFAETELLAQQKRGLESALIVGDIDNFKDFNDAEGHTRGDQILEKVGRTIGHCVRRADVAGRMGGDEFAVLLPGAGLERACSAAESILSALGDVSMSLGVAEDTGSSLKELLQEADSLMYRAKRAGGGRYKATGISR